MSPKVFVFGLVFGVLAASGCAYGEVRQVVRAQFASELDCPEVRITKRDAWYAYDDQNTFKVSGCGVMRTYTCPTLEGRISYDEPACTWVEGDIDAPTVNQPKPDGAMDESEGLDEGAPPDEGTDEPAEPEDPFEDEGGGSEGEGEADDAEPQSSATPKAGARVSGGFRIGTGKK